MITLTELANLSGTDKGTQSGAAHSYSLIYDMLFAPYRSKRNISILELGLAIGGPELNGDINRAVDAAPSVAMWLNYFEDAQIVGFDISDFSKIQHARFKFIRGDAGRREDLAKIVEDGRSFDIIIDDASHASYHQQLSLAVLFEALRPDGLYVIEDLSWQPPQIENSLPEVPLTARLLFEILNSGCLHHTEAIRYEEARRLEEQISGILLFDESYLNALGNSYNKRSGHPNPCRVGWRGQKTGRRLLNPYFWLFSGRRFSDGLHNGGIVSWKSVKLAIIQKSIIS